ncbi:hypothetical protein [Paenibacillus donghaensis]|uniref:S1 motif domain-containing protein n=1 Tax=Paenibacillus donghaensis TaxID=414771 RepID=A0A2Z2K8S6_9BACL|nr:hypothetical protein [Paenibacillus donghaensis]ASA23046.1 hypothetical protein B9T62_20885 [Paenibacillus donghaensis]
MIYLLDQNNGQAWYFEVDEEGTAFRQMLLEDGKESKISNQKKFEFFLSDQDLDINDPNFIRILREEFEQLWQTLNQDQQPLWQKIKQTLPTGTIVNGYIEVFYPQGVIVNIPAYSALGLADYEECAANSKQKNMHKDLQVQAEIIGYDDVNLWVLLGHPKVSDERWN